MFPKHAAPPTSNAFNVPSTISSHTMEAHSHQLQQQADNKMNSNQATTNVSLEYDVINVNNHSNAPNHDNDNEEDEHDEQDEDDEQTHNNVNTIDGAESDSFNYSSSHLQFQQYQYSMQQDTKQLTLDQQCNEQQKHQIGTTFSNYIHNYLS